MDQGRSDLCRLCLSTSRRLSSMEDARWAYCVLTDTPEIPPRTQVCWECRALLLKIGRFRLQALRAQCLLENEVFHGGTDIKCDSGLSRLGLSSKSSFDASFTFADYASTSIQFDVELDEFLDSKVSPKPDEADNDYASDLDVWAESPAPDLVVKTETKSETEAHSKPVTRKRRRKRASSPARKRRRVKNGDMFESFRASREHVSSYRQRLRSKLHKYLYSCKKCVVGLMSKETWKSHNLKYHSIAAGAHVCNICKSRFKTESRMRAHRARHYRMYRCARAGCGFEHQFSANIVHHYELHERVPEEGGDAAVFPCHLCDKRCRTKNTLRMHLEWHASDRTYECDVCGKTFKTRWQIHNHMPMHMLKYVCEVCGKRFAVRLKYEKHALSHLDKYKCKVCNKKLSNEYALMVHTRKHTGEKPFSCDVCETKYTSEEGLSYHTKKYHSGDRKTVRMRPKRVPPDGQPVKCEECDKLFKNNAILRRHKLWHTGERPFACNICESRFAENASLKKHLKTHSDERPLKCDECDKTFKYSTGLWAHKLTHKTDRDVQCTLCPMRFKHKGVLRCHMKTHSKVKPYSCEMCDRTFACKRNSTHHVAMNHGDSR